MHAVRYDFIYDDHTLIVNHPAPRSAGEVLGVFAEGHWLGLPYYRPVARLTMVVQKYLHGDDAAPYHAFNALLMGVLAVLTWFLLRQPALGICPGPAFLGAALVAVHPVASCTVYPICSGRETLMPALFIVAAVTAFLKPGRRWYAAAMGLFAVSLLCKEQAIIVPGLFVLADLLGLSPSVPRWTWTAWLRRYLPVAGILLGYFLVRWLLFQGSGQHQLAVLDRPVGPALSLLYAVQVAFVPFVQLLYEPTTFNVWFSPWRTAVCLAAVFGMAALTVRHRATLGRGGLFWLGWFVLALLPTANLLAQEAPFAERYVLLALVAVAGLAATLASLQWDRTSTRQLIVGCALVLLVACGWISWQRGQYYTNDIQLFTQWIRTDPKSDEAHSGLGAALLPKERTAEAFDHLLLAIRLNPQNVQAHFNLGHVYTRRKDPAKAVSHLRQAASLQPDNATYHFGLGRALAELRKPNEALKHFEIALRINPDYADAHNNLGVLLAQLKKLDAAASHFERAIQLQPDSAEAHFNLGNVFEAQGKLARSVECHQQALRIKPDFAACHAALKRVKDKLRRRKQ